MHRGSLLPNVQVADIKESESEHLSVNIWSLKGQEKTRTKDKNQNTLWMLKSAA